MTSSSRLDYKFLYYALLIFRKVLKYSTDGAKALPFCCLVAQDTNGDDYAIRYQRGVGVLIGLCGF